MTTTLDEQLKVSTRLEKVIQKNLGECGYV